MQLRAHGVRLRLLLQVRAVQQCPLCQKVGHQRLCSLRRKLLLLAPLKQKFHGGAVRKQVHRSKGALQVKRHTAMVV